VKPEFDPTRYILFYCEVRVVGASVAVLLSYPGFRPDLLPDSDYSKEVVDFHGSSEKYLWLSM